MVEGTFSSVLLTMIAWRDVVTDDKMPRKTPKWDTVNLSELTPSMNPMQTTPTEMRILRDDLVPRKMRDAKTVNGKINPLATCKI
jgi:hypothetical protein